jgi:hypothetical protein
VEVRLVDAEVESKLMGLDESRRAKNAAASYEKKYREDVMNALQPYLDDLSLPEGDTRADLSFGTRTARINFGERRTLSRELLLEAGVALDVLERCYEVKPTTTVTVRS